MQQMEQMMKNPAVQQQVQQMQTLLQNPTMQQKMMALRQDPDLQPMWDDVQKNGPMAMMKWYNDPKFVAMIQEKMGDVQGMCRFWGNDIRYAWIIGTWTGGVYP